MEEIWLKTYFLINFKIIKEDEIIQKFLNFLNALINSEVLEEIFENYAIFLEALGNKDLSEHIKSILPKVENNENIQNELDIISELSDIQFKDIQKVLLDDFKDYSNVIKKMPAFKNSGLNLTTDDIKFKEKSRTFIFENNILKQIDINEKMTFKDLKGYDKQKETLYNNTKALLNNQKVNNILLYGDAGCGKSTSVRALLNEFQNIRIVQIFKNDLINLDKLYEILKKMPYKFIIFADDISFDENDTNLSTMKAVLEGSLIQCPDNAVIYATSNRRHLIKESFQSRKGDEIHLNDTLNEINSLSERFGINLLYAKPNNDEFIDIVLKLADDYSLDISKDELIQKAQRLALIKASQSPRIAKQLIESLKNNIEI